MVSRYDPSRAWNGITYFTSRSARRILAVEMDGTVDWDFAAMDRLDVGNANGFEYEDDGTVAYICNGSPMLVNVADMEILYAGPFEHAHHSITMTPWGTLLFLAADVFDIDYEPWYPSTCAQGDEIKELDMETDEVVWEWRLRDHVDPVEVHYPGSVIRMGNGCVDWSHGNTVKFIPAYAYDGEIHQVVLYNALALETFWLIDYPSGEIL